MPSLVRIALASSALSLLTSCSPSAPCKPGELYDRSLRVCLGPCMPTDSDPLVDCYDTDSGMIVGRRDASSEGGGIDATDSSDGALSMDEASRPDTGDASDSASMTDAADVIDANDVADASDALDGSVGDSLASPRLLFPMSLVVLSGHQPTLRWELAAGTDGASIELCRDRAMTADCQRWTATGAASRVPAALARGVWFWRTRGRSGAREGTATSVTWSFWSSGRASARDASYAQIPDINGDGLADVVWFENDTRDPPATPDAGTPDGGAWVEPRLVVRYGQRGGVSSDVVVSPTGAWPVSLAHGFVADVDGDGFGDVVAPALTAGGTDLAAMRLIVLRGSATGLSTMPQWIDAPDAVFGGFGFLQFPIGDADGDGRLDVALCSPGDPREGQPRPRGRCHLFEGSGSGLSSLPYNTLLAPMFAPRPSFAAFLWPAPPAQGDINGDGFADLLSASDQYVDTPAEAVEGRVWFWAGSASGFASTPTQSIVSPSTNNAWGWQLSLAGDLDGDGDLEVSMSAVSTANTYLLFNGNSTGIQTPALLNAPTQAMELGATWRVVGDVTGDGLVDWSRAWLVTGSTTSLRYAIVRGATPVSFAGEVVVPPVGAGSTVDSTAQTMAGVGDLDGDSLFDVFDRRDNRVCFGHASALPNRCVSVASPNPNLSRTLLRPMF